MKTILIVEDEKEIRNNLKEILEREGFNVFAAQDGLEALHIIDSSLPSLILSDIRMPNMDGFELLEKLQQDKSTTSIPFIFLTARVDLEDLRTGMALGADDYIMKPFKIDDLVNSIKARLRKKENEKQLIDDLKRSILRKIPHELLTPLVGILGFSELIQNDIESYSSEEIVDMAEKIKMSGDRLHRRIKKLIIYSDLISHTNKNISSYNFKNSEYQLVSDHLVTNLKSRMNDEKRLKDLSFSFENANLLIKQADLEIMLLEIIENALKFSERNSNVYVSGKKKDEHYVISVKDFGMGMSDTNI